MSSNALHAHAENETTELRSSGNGRDTLFDHVDEFARFLRKAAAREPGASHPETLKAWLDLAEAYRITQALRECKGNRSAAARLLGIGRRTLYAKMDKLEITATWRMG